MRCPLPGLTHPLTLARTSLTNPLPPLAPKHKTQQTHPRSSPAVSPVLQAVACETKKIDARRRARERRGATGACGRDRRMRPEESNPRITPPAQLFFCELCGTMRGVSSGDHLARTKAAGVADSVVDRVAYRVSDSVADRPVGAVPYRGRAPSIW
eukprot:3628925-Rhodomonas_salina.1